MLALATGLLLATPPTVLHVRLSAGAGLSHGLLGPRAELVFGHLGVFGAIGLPQYAWGSFQGFGISPAGGIRYLGTPNEKFSWFVSAQVAKFSYTITDPVCCEFNQENRTSASVTVGLDARAGPAIFSFAVGPAWTAMRRRFRQGGPVIDEGVKYGGGLATDVFIPDFELAVGTEF